MHHGLIAGGGGQWAMRGTGSPQQRHSVEQLPNVGKDANEQKCSHRTDRHAHDNAANVLERILPLGRSRRDEALEPEFGLSGVR